MSVESCISHAPQSRTLIIRQDYIGICRAAKSPHCAAALLSAFEHWTNHKYEARNKKAAINEARKKKGREPLKLPTLWIFMAQEEFIDELLELYGESVIT